MTNREGTPTKAGFSVPRWQASILVLFVWLIGIPFAHGMIPWGVSMLTPRYGWANGHPGIWNLPGLVLISTGGVVLVWLLLTTMVHAPKQVHLGPAPSWLVTRGPYALTRNPMYLAELGVWLGWAIFFGSISVLIGFVIFGLTVDRMVLPQEERTLETAFGQSYLRYKESVPRWLGKRARS